MLKGKPVRTLPATHLFADIFVAKIVDKFMPSPGDAMRKRDLIRAKIEQLEPMLRAECRSHADLGIIQAMCPACGNELITSSDVADVNVVCERCDYVGFRALSNGFGHGYQIPSDSTISTLNRDGERWSDASMAFISKDGERPYLSPHLIIAVAAFTRLLRMLRSSWAQSTKVVAGVAVEADKDLDVKCMMQSVRCVE